MFVCVVLLKMKKSQWIVYIFIGAKMTGAGGVCSIDMVSMSGVQARTALYDHWAR